MPDSLARVDFLRKLHLFRGLSDEQLRLAAESMQELFFPETGVVVVEGTTSGLLYFIYEGNAQVSRLVKDAPVPVATLTKGDYFGEQSLLRNRPHNATVRAEVGSTLLTLSRDAFRSLLKKIPSLRENFLIMLQTRALANKIRFDWLGRDEVIYFLARRHEIILIEAMVLPLLAMLLTLGGVMLAFSITSAALSAAAGFFLVLTIVWGVWNYIDWGNDFYIVTNQRVVWVEKVVGLYDSRSETPLATILSVGTETKDFLERFFGYGTVVVRTFTGEIRMEYVGYPKQAAAMIEEYWNRTKQAARRSDEESFKAAIRAKLGIQLPAAAAPAPAAPPAPAAKTAAPKPRKELFRDRFSKRLGDAFNVRMESGAVITYRKHPYVLFRDTLPQTLSILALLLLLPALRLFFGWQIATWQVMLNLLLLVLATGWWIYGYMDWANDLYQVTPEQLVDVYKEPLSKEERKVAPLESILSMDYQRNGILGMLLNFGTVNIKVGGANFDFIDVMNPPGVQQDISSRMLARKQKKAENDAKAERERMIEWMAWYHKTVEEARKLEEQAHRQNGQN